jgi:hypothetical protein
MPPTFTPEDILKEVRKDVLKVFGRTVEARVKVAPLNPSILGFVRAGEDLIYVNSVPISQVEQEYLSQYLYVVILHEYLHMLGIADEREVRRMTLDLVNERFGERSFAYKMASELADRRDIYLRESWRRGRPQTYM